MFLSIQNLQSYLSDTLLSVQNSMPIISIIQVKLNTNAISFLYDTFGSLDNEDDFIMRNNIQDPFEIKAGSTLQVIV